MGARLPHHRRPGGGQALARQPELGWHQQYLLLDRSHARHRRHDHDAVFAVRRRQGARRLRRLPARRVSIGKRGTVGTPANLHRHDRTIVMTTTQRGPVTAKPWSRMVKKLFSGIAYGLFVAMFVAIGTELLLRAFAIDPPFYYWKFRFQYVSPGALVDRAEGLWTYRPNADLREVAVYGMPSPLAREPRLWVEFDCRMRSNNLGLLQDDDVRLEKPQTIVFGDSFTAGPGGCPWFHKLQARRPQEQLLNAGLLGTGVDQWWRLFEHLRRQGVVPERLLLIAISNDFKRKAWHWPRTDFDCLDRGECNWDGVYSWQPV